MQLKSVLAASVLTSSLLVVPLYPVYAQTPPRPKPASPSSAFKDRIQNKAPNAPVKDMMIDKLQAKPGMASKSAQLREKLAKFRDKVKAERVERIDTRLNTINQNRTQMMTTHLDKLTQILDKLEERVNQAAGNGKDATEALSAINDARINIEAARTVVRDQAAKEYTLETVNEKTVKEEAKTVRDQLHTELTAAQELVKEARKSVAGAVKTAATTLGGAPATPEGGTQ